LAFVSRPKKNNKAVKATRGPQTKKGGKSKSAALDERNETILMVLETLEKQGDVDLTSNTSCAHTDSNEARSSTTLGNLLIN